MNPPAPLPLAALAQASQCCAAAATELTGVAAKLAAGPTGDQAVLDVLAREMAWALVSITFQCQATRALLIGLEPLLVPPPAPEPAPPPAPTPGPSWPPQPGPN